MMPAESTCLCKSLCYWWRDDDGCKVIASALLRHPSQLHELLLSEADKVSEVFRVLRGDGGDNMLEDRWNREVASQFAKRLEQWTPKDKVAGIKLICESHLLSTDLPFPRALASLLKQLAADPVTTAAAKAGQQAVAERWPDDS